MSKKNYLAGTVVHSQDLSVNMRRIVLASEGLTHFPQVKPGAYIKLLFNLNGTPVVSTPGSADDIMLRTYTVRSLDKQNGQLTLDFVLHTEQADSGPASNWASKAKVGDTIYFSGPGSTKTLTENHDWVLLAGDMTALPSIESYLEILPEDCKGYALIKVNQEQDIRPLKKTQGIELIWLTQAQQQLVDVIRQLRKPEGKAAIWAASEFTQMRQMRQLFSNEWNISRNDYYISSYWKQGRSEEQHKIDKRKDQLELETQR